MSTDVERLIARLEVSQRNFERQLARAAQTTNRRAAQIEQRFARTNKTVTAQFAAMGQQVNSVLRTLALPTLTFAGGVALTRSVRRAVTDLSDLGKQARAASLDVEQLQGLMFGLSQATGVGDGEIASAFERFNRRIGEAANGMGPLIGAMNRYGIEVRRANGEIRSQEELLREVASVAARLGDQQRAAFLQSAFGDVGRRLAQGFADGAEGLDRFIERAREAGVVIRADTIRAAEDLDDRFDRLTRRVGTFLKALVVTAAESANLLRATVQELNLSAEEVESIFGPGFLEGLGEDARREVAGVVAEFGALAEQARDTAVEMNNAAMTLQGLGRSDEAGALRQIAADMETMAQAFERGEIAAEDMIDSLADTSDEALRVVSAMDDIGRAQGAGAVLSVNALTGALRAAADMARDTAAAIRAIPTPAPGEPEFPVQTPGPGTPRPRNAPRDIDFGLPPARRGGGGGPAPAAEFARAVEAIRERTAALEAEAVALIATAASGREYGNAYQFAMEKARLLHAAQKDGRQITPELRAEIEALAAAYAEAGDAAERAAEAMRQAEQDAARGADALADLFGGIVSGSTSARDALRQLLAEIARVQMRKAILGLGDTGGFLGTLGRLLTGRASGGGVRSGTPYLVNENTPRSEVFVPSQSGGILNVPQAQAALRGAGAAGRVDVYIHEAAGFASRLETVAQGVAVVSRMWWKFSDGALRAW